MEQNGFYLLRSKVINDAERQVNHRLKVADDYRNIDFFGQIQAYFSGNLPGVCQFCKILFPGRIKRKCARMSDPLHEVQITNDFS